MIWLERFAWYMLILAPWFFMMARLKNMGYTRKDIRRYFTDFGYLVGTLTLLSLVVGAIADVLFNIVIGSLIFLEFPREGFFTDRVQRHYDDWKVTTGAAHQPDRREKKGKIWADRLNRIYAGHVD